MFAANCLPISVTTLVPTMSVGMDLYQLGESKDRLVLYRGREYPIEFADIDRLREHGVKQLYITTESRDNYQAYLRRIAEGDASLGEIPIHAQVGAVNEVVRDLLRTSFSNSDVAQTVQVAGELAEMACNLVSQEGFKSSDLFQVLHHDYTTFTHSANVALYATMLAKGLGFGADEIKQITAGGLLHDLGKLEIPETILCKPGRLDDVEFRVIQMHPTLGFRRLVDREDLTFGQMMMVYQHHERIDGSGYPVRVPGSEIHPWAKLCAVVDIFEAVTSIRPYRKPMPRNEAIEFLRREAGKALDSEMVQCWASTIQTNSTN
jgi:HD-GYP domain-containing protein (c-di-GMP phosphodiesterase class II)